MWFHSCNSLYSNTTHLGCAYNSTAYVLHNKAIGEGKREERCDSCVYKACIYKLYRRLIYGLVLDKCIRGGNELVLKSYHAVHDEFYLLGA